MPEIKTDAKLFGTIFDIQRFSVHDGPGIRTTVFFKGCPLHCFWCQNPESQGSRPEILFDQEKCTNCGQCVAICPKGATTLSGDQIRIDRHACTGCGQCVVVCPNEARKLTGKIMTVAEVFAEAQRDRPFYNTSGGGVTLSGGEATQQATFSLALLRRCKEDGIHTALDTCGCSSWQEMERLLEFTDLVLYDLKCLDGEQHRIATGMTNTQILDNAKKVVKLKETWIRIPLIPGFNDTKDDVADLVRFVRKELGPVKIDLHHYNKLGEDKYARLGKQAVHLDPRGDEWYRELEALSELPQIY